MESELPPNGVLAGNLGVLIETKEVGQEVFYHGNGIGFGNISIPLRHEHRRKTLQDVLDSLLIGSRIFRGIGSGRRIVGLG